MVFKLDPPEDFGHQVGVLLLRRDIVCGDLSRLEELADEVEPHVYVLAVGKSVASGKGIVLKTWSGETGRRVE